MLHEHDRHTLIRPVPQAIRDALVAVFAFGASTSNQRQQELAQHYLAGLREAEYWLACDCAGETTPALLSPRRLESGRVVLVRHGQTAHDCDCPLFRLKSAAEVGAEVYSPPALEQLLANDAGGDVPAGASVLAMLLEACRFNQVSAAELRVDRRQGRVIAADVPGLYQAVDTVAGWPVSPGVELESVWCNHLSGVPGLRRRLAGQPGFLFGIVDEVEPQGDGAVLRHRRGEGAQTEIPASGPIWRASEGEGPWWVLAEVSPAAEAPLGGVAAFPAYSRGLPFPLLDARERAALQLLAGQLDYWARREPEVTVRLTRPLDLPNIAALPDFLLDVAGRGVAVLAQHPAHSLLDATLIRANLTERSQRAERHGQSVVLLDGSADDELRRRLTAAFYAAHRVAASRVLP